MIYFTADEHYHHSNILSFRIDSGRQQRPFTTLAQMHKTLKKHHNEVVRDEDIVYHLGDVYFGRSWQELQNIFKELSGTHILILGNHDWLNPFHYIEAGFQSVHTSLDIAAELYKVGDVLRIVKPTLIHDPAVAGVLTNNYFIHGHTHGLGKQLAPNSYCVSVELTDYYPVPITDIKFGGDFY